MVLRQEVQFLYIGKSSRSSLLRIITFYHPELDKEHDENQLFTLKPSITSDHPD